MLVGVRNNKKNPTNQTFEREVEKVNSVVVHQKIFNSVGRNDNFLAKARKLSILPTSLNILIYGNTVYADLIYLIIR